MESNVQDFFSQLQSNVDSFFEFIQDSLENLIEYFKPQFVAKVIIDESGIHFFSAQSYFELDWVIFIFNMNRNN